MQNYSRAFCPFQGYCISVNFQIIKSTSFSLDGHCKSVLGSLLVILVQMTTEYFPSDQPFICCVCAVTQVEELSKFTVLNLVTACTSGSRFQVFQHLSLHRTDRQNYLLSFCPLASFSNSNEMVHKNKDSICAPF